MQVSADGKPCLHFQEGRSSTDCVTSFFDISTNNGFTPNAGLACKVQQPDGSTVERLWNHNPPWASTRNGLEFHQSVCRL